MKLIFFYIFYIFLISFITYQLYAVDKHNAQKNGPSKVLKYPRIAEINLHIMSIIGGWPGALYAQQTLRHKTIKNSFRNVFWITVIINIILLSVVFVVFGFDN
jgi:uncharacterized membrane protein YsdA (DUF1294 family)